MHPAVEIYSIATLAVFTLIAALTALYTAYRAGFLEKYYLKFEQFTSNYWKHLGFSLALLATSGSLFMSNVLGWAPCRLCWFQRIFMYPMVVLFGVSLLLKTDVKEYVAMLSMIGGGISMYHYMIQRLEQFSSAGCTITSVSCETEYTFYLGIVTVPLMAFTAFLGIFLLSLHES